SGVVAVVEAAAEQLRERGRQADRELGVARAGLEQQHPQRRILAETAGERAPRRAGADHDEVELGHRPIVARSATAVARGSPPGFRRAARLAARRASLRRAWRT